MKNFCKAKEAMTKRKRAFTLVEVLIVVVIIGILFVTLMVNLGFSTDKANTAGVQNDFHAFQTAIQIVAMEEQGLNVPIESLKLSINKRLDTGLKLSVIEGGSMYSSGVDPWGTEYRLDYSRPENTNGQIVLVSAGPDNKYDTADDIKSTIRYDTSDGNKVVVDGEILEQDTNIFNTELIFKPEINDTEFKYAFDTCTHKSESSMLAISPTSFTTYTLVEGTNYSITGSEDGTGIKVVKYVANGVSYWHLNQKAAAYVGQPESGWYTVNGSTYTKYDTVLSVRIANSDNVNTVNYEGLKYLFNGVHEHDYSSKVLSSDYVKIPGTCGDKTVYYFACTCGRISTTTFEGEKDASNHPADDDKYKHEYIPSTTENHLHVATCLVCNEVVVNSNEPHDFGGSQQCKLCKVQKHIHDYSSKNYDASYRKSAATCTSPAVYYWACTSCPARDETKTFTDGQALGHEGEAATCTTSAFCTRCNNTYQAALGHDFSRQIVRADLQKSEATCTKPAVYYCLCVRCDEVSTTTTWQDNGSAIGHIFNQQNTDDKYLAVAATCVTPAKYYFSCKCGEFNSTIFVSGTANGSHIGGTRIEYEQIKDDYSYHIKETVCETCSTVLESEQESHVTQDNLFCYLCDFEIHVCDYSVKKEEDAYLSFPATCTTTAVYYFACAEPNCTKHGVRTYPSGDALGHNYTSSTTTDPTCTNTGIKTHVCNRTWINPVNGSQINCNNSYTSSIPELGHLFTKEDPQEYHLARAATCMDSAAYYLSCSRDCGAHGDSIFVYGDVNPNAHFGSIIVGGTSTQCTKYSCCNTTGTSTHQWDMKTAEYYWNSNITLHQSNPTQAARCNAFVMFASCGTCGYTNRWQKSIQQVNPNTEVKATCTTDGNPGYHYVAFTINGKAYEFKCNEHNTPLQSSNENYQVAYNNYHPKSPKLNHDYPSSFDDATYVKVDFDYQDECNRAQLTLTCKRCGVTKKETVGTTEITTVAQSCGVPKQWVMQAKFSIGNVTCAQVGPCTGHSGSAIAHLGNTVNGIYSGTTLVDGTRDAHSSCNYCKQVVSTTHTFTAVCSQSGHGTSAGTMTYTATCACGYSYTANAVTTQGTTVQSQNCSKDGKAYYSYTVNPASGNTSVNSAIKTAVQNAWSYANMRCCSGSHVFATKTNKHDLNGTATKSLSCSSPTSSWYKLYCSQCNGLQKTLSPSGITEHVTTNATCTVAKKSYNTIYFKDNDTGKTYGPFDCTTHTGSSLGHNMSSTYTNHGCAYWQGSTYNYQKCLRSGCSYTVNLGVPTTCSSFVFVWGYGMETHGSYTPPTSGTHSWTYVSSGSPTSSSTYVYRGAGETMYFCAGAPTWENQRARAYIKYNGTEVAHGTKTEGGTWTLTLASNTSYTVVFHEEWVNAGRYYWIEIKSGSYNSGANNSYVHGHSDYDSCDC